MIFTNGLTVGGFHCVYCDARRNGRIYQEHFRWRVKMGCGHQKTLGYVKPLDQLNEEGLINQDYESPMARSRRMQEAHDRKKKDGEWNQYIKITERLTRGKMYF